MSKHVYYNRIICTSIKSIFESTILQLNEVFVVTIKISLIKLTTKTVNDANIEEREEYLKISDITNHVNRNSKNN